MREYIEGYSPAAKAPYQGHGILNSDGELWAIQRKAGLRFFSNSNLQRFIDITLPPLLDDLHGKLQKAAKEGSAIDLQACFLELTTRLMGTIAYDVRVLSSPMARLS